MRSSTVFAAIAALLLVSGCTKFELLDATVPRYGYDTVRGLAYGHAPRQTLDIYLPDTESETPRPVILFFYGGSWQRGSKEAYRFVGESFSKRGYIVVVADYRLYPEVQFPTFVYDSAKAVRWVHDHIAAYGGDARNLYLVGHSAGAYNAMMLTVDARYLASVGGSSRWLRGVAALSGPYDFLPATQLNIDKVFATAPAQVSQPLKRVNRSMRGAPPIFMATGDADVVVAPANTERMAKRLRAQGARVETRFYAGAGHLDVGQSLASSFSYITPAVADVADFIEHTRTK